MAIKSKEKEKVKKKKVNPDIEETKKALKKKKSAIEETEFFDAYAELDSMLDVMEKQENLTAGSTQKVKISTGLLVLDLILGGGLTTGSWVTFFGGEQSSKSTLSMAQLAQAATEDLIKVLMYFDFEGSYSSDYMMAIAKSLGYKGDITDLFGVQDDEGNYVKKARIRRYSANVAEKFFNMVYRLEKSLPDKLYKKGKWWFVYDDTKENAKYKKHANPKMLQKTKRIWIEAPNDAPQALIVVDSYPAMLPEKMDDEEGKNGIGAQARMFSEQLKRIKGRMEAKGIIIMGINQLREKPMVMYGPTEYEPGGQALKFFSDVRLKMASRAAPQGEPRKKNSSSIVEEPSIEHKGCLDTYRYVNVKAIKNKLSSGSDMDCWLRIWVRDGEGQARGYDPVWDTAEFLRSIGVMTGSRDKLVIDWAPLKIKGLDDKQKMKWVDFKKLVTGDKKRVLKVLSETGYEGKAFNLRKKLFELVKSKKAQKMYFETISNKAKGDSDESDD